MERRALWYSPSNRLYTALPVIETGEMLFWALLRQIGWCVLRELDVQLACPAQHSRGQKQEGGP